MSSVSHADNQQDTEANSFPTLREANLTRQLEWDADGQITLSYRGNELAGEVGEACNVIKKLERERMGIRGSRDTLEHLAEELADVMICVDLIASSVGIDLDKAVRDKFNATSEKMSLKTRLVDGNAHLKMEVGRRFTVEEMNQIVTRKVAEHLRALT